MADDSGSRKAAEVEMNAVLGFLERAVCKEGPAIGKEFVVILPEGQIRKARVLFMLMDQLAGVALLPEQEGGAEQQDTLPTSCLLATYSVENFDKIKGFFAEAQKSLCLHLYAEGPENTDTGLDMTGKFMQPMPKAVQ